MVERRGKDCDQHGGELRGKTSMEDWFGGGEMMIRVQGSLRQSDYSSVREYELLLHCTAFRTVYHN